MDVKEYLGRAYRIDQRINSKLEQVHSLHELATKATSTLSDMPRSPSPNQQTMEATICKIVDLEAEINADIDELVDLKREMVKVIKSVENREYQMILELRYLCFKPWEEIAIELGYSIHHLYKVHNRAVDFFGKKLKVDTK